MKDVKKYHKKGLPDMEKITNGLEAMGKVKMPNFEAMINNGLPDMEKITNSLEAMGKIKTPNFEAMINNGLPDMEKITNSIEAMGKIKMPDFEAIINNGLPDMDKIISLGQTLATFSDKIAEIDWTNYELTNQDIEQARDILEDENAAKKIYKELREEKELNKMSKPIRCVLIFIYRLIMFLAAIAQVAVYTEDRVIPVMQSYIHYEQEGMFQSKIAGINWMNDELKKDVSSQIINNFRIVAKDNLIVREGKRKDSRIAGKLDTGYVVQILEKKKNWSYVLYSNYESDEVIEGWTFTRYLKQIK